MHFCQIGYVVKRLRYMDLPVSLGINSTSLGVWSWACKMYDDQDYPAQQNHVNYWHQS